VDVAATAFRLLDPRLDFEVLLPDGSDTEPGQVVARAAASARALLIGERTSLNVFGRMCGIATATRELVRLVAPYRTRVVCTRKTTPGLRAVEKYAVRVGGGANHRFGLDDAVLVKDNHVALAGGIRPAVERVRRAVGPMVKIEVEVDTLAQLDEALAAGVEAVLLDNMSVETMAQAVAMARGTATTEASGGITPANAAAIAATGVDIMSAGWLTHSARALDVSLEIQPA
jgi:nicotinate-nucleotide pyrophosphorylase (carboxylating)